jgi:hypothetical protein
MTDPSEAEFQKTVITLAKLHRWKVMHTQPAQVRAGRWITPNTGDQGFPDLVMVHPVRGTIFVELKATKGVVSNMQWEWINALEDAGQEVHVWRPKDLDKISARLARKPPIYSTRKPDSVWQSGHELLHLCHLRLVFIVQIMYKGR